MRMRRGVAVVACFVVVALVNVALMIASRSSRHPGQLSFGALIHREPRRVAGHVQHGAPLEERFAGDQFAQRIAKIEQLVGVKIMLSAQEASDMMIGLQSRTTSLLTSDPLLRNTSLVDRLVQSVRRHPGGRVSALEDEFVLRGQFRAEAMRSRNVSCALRVHKIPVVDDKTGAEKHVSVEYVVAAPNSGVEPTGVLVAFHGCGHDAKDFCRESPTCPKCRGLPEELGAVADAVALGFVIVAVSSPQPSKCWKQTGFFVRKDKTDLDIVGNSGLWNVVAVLREEGILETTALFPDEQLPRRLTPATLSHLPLVIAGASSGGSILRQVAKTLGPRVIGIIAQISAPIFSDFAPEPSAPSLLSRPLNPTIFFDIMSRDAASRGAATAEVKRLSATPAAPVMKPSQSETRIAACISARQALRSLSGGRNNATAFVLTTPPLPLTPRFFSSRMGVDVISDSDSAAVVDILLKGGLVGESDHQLKDDPRRSHWKRAVQAALKSAGYLQRDSLAADKSPLGEEMNVAYGRHEFFADHMFAMLLKVICRD